MEQQDGSEPAEKKADPKVEVGATHDVEPSGTPSEKVDPTRVATAEETKAASDVPSMIESTPTVPTPEPATTGNTVEKSPEVQKSTEDENTSIEIPQEGPTSTVTVATSPKQEIVASLVEQSNVSCAIELKQDHLDTTIHTNEGSPPQSDTVANATANNEASSKEDSQDIVLEPTEKCVSPDVVTIEEDDVRSDVADAKFEVQESNPETDEIEKCTQHEEGLSRTKMDETESMQPPPANTVEGHKIPVDAKKDSDNTSPGSSSNDNVLENSSSLPATGADSQKDQTSEITTGQEAVATTQPMDVEQVISESGTGNAASEECMDTEEVADSKAVGQDETVSDAIASDCVVTVTPEVAAALGSCSVSPEHPADILSVTEPMDQIDDSVALSDAGGADTTDCNMELDDTAPMEDDGPSTGTEPCSPQPEVTSCTKQPTSQSDLAKDTHPVLPDNKRDSPSPAQVVPDVDIAAGEPAKVKQASTDKSPSNMDEGEAGLIVPCSSSEPVSEPNQQSSTDTLPNIDSVTTVTENIEAADDIMDLRKQNLSPPLGTTMGEELPPPSSDVMQCMAENETAVPDEASTPVVVPMDTCRADMPTVQNMGRQESTVSNDVVQVEATYAGVSPLHYVGGSSLDRLTSEESTASESSLIVATVTTRRCAFCNCGERSLLGQGDLTRYDATPGFNPFRRQVTRGTRSSGLDLDDRSADKGSRSGSSRRSRAALKPVREKVKSPRCSSIDTDIQTVPLADELNHIGYAEEVDPSAVLEKTGHVWAHHCCAAWSEGVTQLENGALQFVDKAVCAALSQKCNYCLNYGATIVCRDIECAKKYHYPCASGGGCFQDIKTLSLLCPEHIEQAEVIAGQEAYCVVCDRPGYIADQLFCTSCGQHYHGNCLDPPVEVNAIVRAGWQCPECKICQTCRQPGDDNRMLVCDTCDKGYHTFCLDPVMTTIPKNGWKCKNCRVCGDCGACTPGSGPSSRWHHNYSVCDGCYQQRNKGLSCPLCGRAYRHFIHKQMAQCTLCSKYVHTECDTSMERDKKGVGYICPICRNEVSVADLEGSACLLSHMVEEGSPQDIENFEIFKSFKDCDPTHDDGFQGNDLLHSSQESLLGMTEDSISSMDIDLNALEKGVQQLASLGGISTAVSVPIHDGTSTTTSSAQHSGLSSPRHFGPGMGKPSFGKKMGKKIGAGRPKNRSIAPGKKRQRAPPMTDRSSKRTSNKPKIKTGHTGGASSGQAGGDSSKDDDHQSTAVISATTDEFVLGQDMCMSCGSYGSGEEGQLIVCVQCGQCYHPYCANMKINKVVLQKGWRCLDCTVCEGCGKPHDEGRLILCDECDISYHIYCLNPPLDAVPKGTWKCKWCVCCETCGSTTPGVGCQWQNNYSQCGPCYSLSVCPVCQRSYKEDDMIIQCAHCERWLHIQCDGIKNDDEAERAASYGYHCLLCRPLTGVDGPFPPAPQSPQRVPSPLPLSSPPSTPPVHVFKDSEPVRVPKQFMLDGVMLSERGLQLIKSMAVKMTDRKRVRRRPEANRHPNISRLLQGAENAEQRAEPLEVDGAKGIHDKVGSDSTNVCATAEKQEGTTDVPSIEKKKKSRIRIGMGVGGFMVRHRSKSTVGLVKESVNPLVIPEMLDGKFEEKAEEEGPVIKKRRRRRPKKSKMEDDYPSYLQMAFFGKSLIDKGKEGACLHLPLDDRSLDEDTQSADPLKSNDPFAFPDSPVKTTLPPQPAEKELLASANSGVHNAAVQLADPVHQMAPQSDDDSDKIQALDEGDLKDLLPTDLLQHDEDLISMLEDEDLGKTTADEMDTTDAVSSSQDCAVPPSSSAPAVPPPSTDHHKGDGDHLDNLDQMLDHSLEMNKEMEADVDSLLSHELAQIDSKTVEDIFKGVLEQGPGPSPTADNDGNFQLTSLARPTLPGEAQLPPRLGGNGAPQLPVQTCNMAPGSGEFQSHGYGDAPGSVAWQAPLDEGEPEALSYNKRSMLKWEKDETLGDLSTISPVLYCNINHPELKTDHPEWSERVKQISKIWRRVPSEEKPPFLAKARENRANSRLLRPQKLVGQEMKKKAKPTRPVGGPGATARDESSLPSPQKGQQTPPSAIPMDCQSTGSQESQDASGAMFGMSSTSSQSPQQIPPSFPSGDDSRSSQPFHPKAPSSTNQLSGLSPDGSAVESQSQDVFKSPPPPPRPHDPYAPGPYMQRQGLPDMFGHPAKTPGQHMSSPPGQRSNTGRNEQEMPFGPYPPTQTRSHDLYGQSELGEPSGGVPLKPRSQMSSQGIYPAVARPSAAPFDPYAQMPRTPRPQSTQRANQDPYALPPGTPRPQDPYAQPPGTPRPQDPYAQMPSTPRPQDPYVQPPGTPRSQDPYAQPPSTPRPQDPYAQMPSTPRPQDPYAQPPSTPRPQDPYAQMPSTPIPQDPYAQMPSTSRPQDPYAQLPGTPRPQDPYSQPPGTPRPQDPYAQTPGTPRPQDPYAQPPGTPRPGTQRTIDPFSQIPNAPRSSDAFVQPQGPLRPQDPFAQPGMRMPKDPFASAPRPPLDQFSQNPYVEPPGTSGHGDRFHMQLALPPTSIGSELHSDLQNIISGSRQRYLEPRDQASMAGMTAAAMQHPMYLRAPGYHGVLTPGAGPTPAQGVTPAQAMMWSPFFSAPMSQTEVSAAVMDGAKTESQRQQLRELLAKQTKQRQTKKKQIEEQERILHEQQPPQQWPTGPGFPAFSPDGEPRPPPSYPGTAPLTHQRPPRGPIPGAPALGGFRQPQPGQIRPDPNGFHGVGQPMMPMQPGLHPGQQGARSPGAADPGFPRMMGPGNAGSPRGIYPMGQYPQLQQMPGQFMKLNQQELSPAERHRIPYLQMFQERLRQAGGATGSLQGTPPPMMSEKQRMRMPSTPPSGGSSPVGRFDSHVFHPGGPPMQHSLPQQGVPMRPGMMPFRMPPNATMPGMQMMGDPRQMHPQYAMQRMVTQEYMAAQSPGTTTGSPMEMPPAVPNTTQSMMAVASQLGDMTHHPSANSRPRPGPQGALHQPVKSDVEKSDDHLDELLGVDDSFNLLEYADPELDETLTEPHDKNMFDEHLGVQTLGRSTQQKKKVNKPKPKSPRGSSITTAVAAAASTMARSVESTPVTTSGVTAPVAKSPAGVATVTTPPAGDDTVTTPPAGGTTAATTSTSSSASPTTSASSSPSQSVAATAKPVPHLIKRSPRRSRSASGTPIATTTQSNKPSTESTKTSVVGKDFQAKFLEFSQRRVEMPDDEDDNSGSTKGETAKKRSPATRGSPAKDSGNRDNTSTSPVTDNVKKSSLAMQVDGCADNSSDFDSDDELHDLSTSKFHLLESIECGSARTICEVSPLTVIVDSVNYCGKDEREACEMLLKVSGPACRNDAENLSDDSRGMLVHAGNCMTLLPLQVDGAGDEEEEVKTSEYGAGTTSETVSNAVPTQPTQECVADGDTVPQPSTPGSQPRTPVAAPSVSHSPLSQQLSPRILQPPPYPGKSPTGAAIPRHPQGFVQTGPAANHPNMSPRSVQSPGTRSMPSPLASPRSVPPQQHAVASPCQQGAVPSPLSIHSPQSHGGTPQMSPRGAHTPLSLSQPSTPQPGPVGMHPDLPHAGQSVPASMTIGMPPQMYGGGNVLPFTPGQAGHPRMHPGMVRIPLQGAPPRKSFLPPENWARILNRLQMGTQQRPDMYGGQKKALDSALLSQLVCLSQMPRAPGQTMPARPGTRMQMPPHEVMQGMPPGSMPPGSMPPGSMPPNMPSGAVFSQQQQQQMERPPGVVMPPGSQQLVMNMAPGSQQAGIVMPASSQPLNMQQQQQPGMNMLPGSQAQMQHVMPPISAQQQWALYVRQQRPAFSQGMALPATQQPHGMPPQQGMQHGAGVPQMLLTSGGMMLRHMVPNRMPPPGTLQAPVVQPPPPPSQQQLASTASQQKDRLPLLEEQPLLLEDLLEQEKEEQRRQAEQQAKMQKLQAAAPPDGSSVILTDADLDKLQVDVLDDAGSMAPPRAASFPGQPPSLRPPVPTIRQMQPRMQHPMETGWPQQGGGQDIVSPLSMPNTASPMFSPQLSPRTPSPFTTTTPPSGVHMQPGVVGGAVPSPTQQMVQPVKPQMPPRGTLSEPLTEAERQLMAAYEEWLVQNAQWLEMRLKPLEQQVIKQRKMKKSLSAKQRQLRKSGGELTEPDAHELARISQEQSVLQKQLEQLRKQYRTHQQLMQDYWMKQQQQQQQKQQQQQQQMQGLAGMPGPVGPMPPHMMGPSPRPPSSTSLQSPVVPPARAPGSAGGNVRLPAEKRQEYEAYMQERLRAMNQMNQPPPQPLKTSLVSGDENNPFSESYQQRENIEKQHHGFVGQKQELQRPQADTQVKPQLAAVSQSPLDGAGVEMKASAQGVSQMPPGLIPAPPSQKNGVPLGQPGSAAPSQAFYAEHIRPRMPNAPPDGNVQFPPPMPPLLRFHGNRVGLVRAGGPPFSASVPFPRELPVPPLHMGPGGDSIPLSHPPVMVMYGQPQTQPGQTVESQQQMEPGVPLSDTPSGGVVSTTSPTTASTTTTITTTVSTTVATTTTTQPTPAPSPATPGGATSGAIDKPKKKVRRRKRDAPGLVQMQGLRMQSPGPQQFHGPRMPSPMMPSGHMLMQRLPPEVTNSSLSELQQLANMQMMTQDGAVVGGGQSPMSSQQMTGTPLPGTWLPPGGVQSAPGQMMHRQQSPGTGQSTAGNPVISRPQLVSGAHAMSSATQALIDLKNLQSHSMPAQMALLHDDGVRGQSMSIDSIKVEVDSAASLPCLAASLEQDAELQRNVLLKKLLATPKPRNGMEPQLPLTEEGEENIPLTPEQRRQLEMIESMPLTVEMEISQEEWDQKTSEEKEKILDASRQQAERVELHAATLLPDDTSMQHKAQMLQQQQRQKKQKKREPELKDMPMSMLQQQAKKRQRKGSTGAPLVMTQEQSDHIDEVVNAVADLGAGSLCSMPEPSVPPLAMLPGLSLQEPNVRLSHHAFPIVGAELMTGKSKLQGEYGHGVLEGGLFDLYGYYPFTDQRPLLPPLPAVAASNKGADDTALRMAGTNIGNIPGRRHLLTDSASLGAEVPLRAVTCSASGEPRYSLRSEESLLCNLDLISGRPRSRYDEKLVLPTPPLIEARLNMLSRGSNQSPSTIVSSSSPECSDDVPDTMFPGLIRLISLDGQQGREAAKVERDTQSPEIPIICPVPIKHGDLRAKREALDAVTLHPTLPHEKDKENSLMEADDRGQLVKSKTMSTVGRPLRDAQNQVSVTMTLSAGAAEDIGGVIAAIADLLKIAVPPSYEIDQSETPSDYAKLALGGKHKEEAVNVQSLIRSKTRFCRHCDVVVINPGIQKKRSEILYLSKEEQDMAGDDEDITFCSMNCFMQFELSHQAMSTDEAKEAIDLVEHKLTAPPSLTPLTSRVTVKLDSIPQPLSVQTQNDAKSLPPSAPVTPTGGVKPPLTRKDETPTVQPKVVAKRWKGIRYRKWDDSLVKSQKVSAAPLTDEQLNKMMEKMSTTVHPTSLPIDRRSCVLCHLEGDAPTDGPGRLLILDIDKWVHLNCALWSYEVYETMNGALVNVDAACKRGLALPCTACSDPGATVGCFKPRCPNIYHVTCAQKAGVMFFQDKTLLCPTHVPKTPVENELNDLSVFRRVYINRDENREIASTVHKEEKPYTLRIGSLLLHNIGQLLPHQIQTNKFNTKDCIYPVGFETTRYYWSYRLVNQRCRYHCKIDDNDGKPEFSIRVIEEGFTEVVEFKGNTPKEVWLKVLEPMERMRRESDLVKVFPSYLSGEDLFGLTEMAVIWVIESLPCIELCSNYSIKFGRSPLIEQPLTINPTGCARSEPKHQQRHFRRSHTLQTSNTRSLPQMVTLIPGDAPYMKQFVHSKSQQYRRLKTEWRNNVYLRRSNVQGLGLFADRDLEKHTMVIEYIGQLISNEVAEKREKIYEQQNRGVYMFRIDDNLVIDATMTGGPARYINHSCNPNCVAEVVPFEKDSKIIIIAKRRLARGEELTYDYKFDYEDDQHKIPCLCGAPNCRKWMN